MYSSVFNNPVTNQYSQQKKDLYMAQAQSQLDNIKSQDLSKFSIQQQASSVFQPFLKDSDLQYDIAATHNAQREMDHAEGLRNSSDKENRDRYWDTGLQYIQNGLKQLRDATPDQLKWAAQEVNNRKYVDAFNATDYLDKKAKELGLNIE